MPAWNRLIVRAALGLLVGTLSWFVAASASAQTPPAASSASLIGPVGLPPAFGAAVREGGRERSTPQERERSRSLFAGQLSVGEARVLARRAVPGLTAKTPLPDAGEVQRVVDENTLVVDAPEGDGSQVLQSNLPVAERQGGGWRLADLDVTPVGGGFAPRAGLGEVRLPADAAAGIEVGGLGVDPGVQAVSAGSASEDTVTYPNVATDTDLTVRTLPAGFETVHVLRSPSAPQELDFDLSRLPVGATVSTVGEGDLQGVEVRDAAGKELLGFSAVRAWDADGLSVPASYEVAGGRVRLRVPHQGRDVRYPLVVDPYVQQNWGSGSGADTDYGGWAFEREGPQSAQIRPSTGDQGPFFGKGLFVSSLAGSRYRGDNLGQWVFRAPGDYSGPYTSRATITKFDAIDFSILNPTYSAANPCLTLGLYDPVTRYWDSRQARVRDLIGTGWGPYRAGPATYCGARSRGWQEHTLTPGTSLAGKRSNAFVMQLGTKGTGAAGTAIVGALRWYGVQYEDQVPPSLEPPVVPGGWIGRGVQQAVRGIDRGLGVQRMEVRSTGVPSGVPPVAAFTFAPSPTIGQRVFPFDVTRSFGYDQLPEGVQTVSAVSVDGAGLASPWRNFGVKVDRSGPGLALSGDLYDQRATPIPAGGSRTLSVGATDGELGGPAGAQRSGVERVEVYMDGQPVASASQPEQGDSRPLSFQWQTDQQLAAGPHQVRVVATDRLGQASEQTFAVQAECCAAGLDDGVVDVGDRASVFGDFDGDGRGDVGLVDRDSGALAVAAGRGDGTFAPDTSWGSFGEPVDRVAAGNVDGDEEEDADVATGTDDLVVRTTSGALRVGLSDGSTFVGGTSSGTDPVQDSWPAGRSLGLADVDGDTRLDLWGVDEDSRRLTVAYSRGGAFDAGSVWTTVPQSRDVDMADLDGDALADLVTYEPSDGAVRFHQSDGEQLAPTDVWGQAATGADLALGDVDANGLKDAVQRQPDEGSQPGPVTARRSSRNEGFVAGTSDLGALSSSFTLNAVDLTGDGSADVVGTRVQDGELLLRSSSSTVPDPHEPDPTPADPDPDDGSAFGALAADGPVPIMMSDDAALYSADGLPSQSPDPEPTTQERAEKQQLLEQMSYLGADRLRTVAYWGRMDRLNPSDEQSSMLVLADGPPQAPPGRAGGPQSESNPPEEARRFRLRRDVESPVDLADTVADRRPEWIAGEWRHIENRWYRDNLALLESAAEDDRTIHLTVTGGGGGQDFVECGSGNARGVQLQVRGCQSRDTPTGRDPDPKRAAHAIGEISEQARDVLGGRVGSVGVWNEPNITGTTFLSRPKSTNPDERLDTSRLYGRIYAEAYADLRRRDLLGAGKLRVAFGELTSARSHFDGYDENARLRVRTPAQWTASALDEAKNHPGVTWDSGRVRADIMAIHPYQHTNEPWERNGQYPWGVHGVGKPTKRTRGSKITSPSLKGFLSANADDTLRRVGADRAIAPDIWATEFGYYNSKAGERLGFGNATLGQGYAEPTRSRFLTYESSNSKGALPALAEDGNVKVISFWEVLEDPLPGIAPRANLNIRDDSGFIGSGKMRDDVSYTSKVGNGATGSWPLQGEYVGQFLQLTGIRVYGKALTERPKKRSNSEEAVLEDRRYDGLQWPQNRRTACAIRRWRDLDRAPVAEQPRC